MLLKGNCIVIGILHFCRQGNFAHRRQCSGVHETKRNQNHSPTIEVKHRWGLYWFSAHRLQLNVWLQGIGKQANTSNGHLTQFEMETLAFSLFLHFSQKCLCRCKNPPSGENNFVLFHLPDLTTIIWSLIIFV